MSPDIIVLGISLMGIQIPFIIYMISRMDALSDRMTAIEVKLAKHSGKTAKK